MKKKITTTSELFTVLATAELTTYHYKIWLLLATEPLTQTQIAEKLFVKKQNIRKHIADLERLGLIAVDRVEGRNKFLTAVTTTPPPMPNKDQMSLFDDNHTAELERRYNDMLLGRNMHEHELIED